MIREQKRGQKVFIIAYTHAVPHPVLPSQTDMKNEEQTFMASVQKKPASVIEGVICFFSVWSILGLAGFHTYLTTSNQTTNEDVSHRNTGEMQ